MFSVTAYVNLASRRAENYGPGFSVVPINHRSNCRKSKILGLFLFAMFAVIIASKARATTLIAVRGTHDDGSDLVLIGADSRVMPSGPRLGQIVWTTCKIRQFNGVVAAFAGYYGKNLTKDIWQTVVESVEMSGPLSQIADRFQYSWKAKIEQIHLDEIPPKMRKDCEDNSCVFTEALFAKIEDGTPKLAGRSLMVRVADGKVNVVLGHNNCPGDCPTGYGTFFLGQHDAAARLETSPAFQENRDFVWKIARLIQAEINASADGTVGGPISVFELSALFSGFRFPGVCQSH